MSGGFTRNTATVFGAQVAGFLTAFAASVVLTRMLGPVGKGEYTAIITFCAFVVLVGGMSLGNAAIYFLARETAARGPIAGAALGMQLAAVLALSAILLPLLPWLAATLFAELPAALLAIGLLIALPTAAAETIGLLLLGAGFVARYGQLRLALSLGQIAALGGLALNQDLSVYTALLAYAVVMLGIALLGGIWLRRSGVTPTLRGVRLWVKPLLSYGGRAWLGNLLQYFNYRLDVFLLLGMAGAAAVGQYSVSVALAEALWFLPQSLALVIFPRTATDNAAANTFTPIVVRNTILMTAIGALALGLIAAPVIPLLYGEAFGPAYVALLILLPGVVLFAAAKVIAGDLNGRGMPQYGTWGALASLVLTISLDLLLIPLFGINGAALASTIAYAANAGLLIRFYRRVTGCPLGELLLVRPADLVLYRRFVQRITAKSAQ